MELELIVNGEVLDLAEGTSISMVFNNSLLDSEVLQGSYSLPFTLPDTPKNKRILKWPEVIESLADLETEYTCQLRYEVILINAILKIRDVKRKGGYPVNLFTDLGMIAEGLKNIKLNQLPLQSIPLPFETRPTVSTRIELDGSITPGTLIIFKVFRQDFSNYFFPVKWAGSLSQFLTDLVARITTPSPAVPSWNLGTTYNLLDVVQDESGNYWEARYNGITGKVPQTAMPYNGATAYSPGYLVFDGGFIFEALLPSTGVATSNSAYWENIGEEEYWLFLSSSAGWPAAWRSGVTPKYYLFDDPFYPFNLGSEFFESTLYLYDEAAGGTSPLDYVLIWSQSIPDLAISAGLQNLDSSSLETNFRLPINRMLQGQLGKKWPETNFVFLPYRNTGSFDDSLLDPASPTREYVNYFVDGQYQYGNVNLSNASKQFFVPQVAVGYILEKLFEELGVNHDLSLFHGSSEAFDRLHLYNSRAAVKYVREVGGDGYFTFPFEILLADHVPSIALAEFINALRQFLFLGFVFDYGSKTFKVVRLKDVLTSPSTKDWTSKADPEYRLDRENPGGFSLAYTHDGGDEKAKNWLPDLSKFTINDPVADLASLPTTVAEIGKIRYVEDLEAYYLASWSTANTVTWSFFSRYLQPLQVGDGKTSRKPAISTVLDERLEDEIALSEFSIERYWQVPSVAQKLAIPDLNIDSAATLRILFNWGMQPDSSAGLYPFGSPQNKTYSGSLLGSLALRYDTDAGIYNKLGKEWLAFLQSTKKVYQGIRISSQDVAQLAQSDSIRIDRVDYLWKTFKVTFPIRKEAEFELWKKNR